MGQEERVLPDWVVALFRVDPFDADAFVELAPQLGPAFALRCGCRRVASVTGAATATSVVAAHRHQVVVMVHLMHRMIGRLAATRNRSSVGNGLGGCRLCQLDIDCACGHLVVV